MHTTEDLDRCDHCGKPSAKLLLSPHEEFWCENCITATSAIQPMSHRDMQRRLDASWNACDGIPTAALTPGLLVEMRDALRTTLFALDMEKTRALAKYEAAYAPLRETLDAILAKLESPAPVS